MSATSPRVHVPQRDRFDCGVACAAMAAGVSYERAHEAFSLAGLVLKWPKRPYSSNFKDLRAVLLDLGVATRQVRFPGFERLPGPAILKVEFRRRQRNWHWVFAEPVGQRGTVWMHDPALPGAWLHAEPAAEVQSEFAPPWAPQGACILLP